MINQAEITFCINCCDHDISLVRPLINRLTKLYPNSNVFLVGDGLTMNSSTRIIIADLVSCFDIDFVDGYAVKQMHFGGYWTKRYLDHFSKNYNTPVLIKLDPDVIVNHRFNEFPSECNVFGTVNELIPGFSFVRGACIGFYNTAVETILHSRLLEKEIYRDPHFGYDRYNTYRKKGEKKSDVIMSCQDRILGHICRQLSLSICNWDEVQILMHKKVKNPDQYAVICND